VIATPSAKVVSPVRASVNVPVAGPTSEAVASVAAIVITGVGLSAIVTMSAAVAPGS
jgi:hypothetical protein